MLLVKCKCGHEMQVSEDSSDAVFDCPKCRGPIRSEPESSGLHPAQVMARGVGLDKKRIGELLVGEGLVSSEELSHALEIQSRRGNKVVETLVDLGYLSVEDFVRFLSRQPGVASIDLSHYQIPKDLIELVPKEIAIKHEVFPIDRMGKLMTLGMACPLDSATVRKIEERTGLKVKALLCSADDIRKAIRQYYPMDHDEYFEMASESRPIKGGAVLPRAMVPRIETGLKLHRISKLIRDLHSLPALPSTVERVHEAMNDISVSPSEVADIILHDPPIAAKVLSVANSAAYGFTHRIATVQLAVALMGLKETYSIVLSAAVLNLFDKSPKFDYGRYWEESMNCAAATRIIAKACGRGDENCVFTAGLLHDIGRIALLETAPELYAKISPGMQANELVVEEERVVGLSHTEAGFELATHWNLPPEIAQPIRFHHRPEFATEAVDYVCMVALAEEWTRVNTERPSPTEAQLREWTKSFRVLGMDAAAAAAAYEDAARLERVRFDWSANRKTGDSDTGRTATVN